jgi:hypothetical protein
MRTYVGPNGRIYRRASHTGRWIAATIACVVVISVGVMGVSNFAEAFHHLGF